MGLSSHGAYGCQGIDDGDFVTMPWARESITEEDFLFAPVVGTIPMLSGIDAPIEVRMVRGEGIARGQWGGFFAPTAWTRTEGAARAE